MHPWRDAPTTAAYAVGDVVCSGDCRGVVVAVDADKATMGVVWSDGDEYPITYPMDASYLRKRMPWE